MVTSTLALAVIHALRAFVYGQAIAPSLTLDQTSDGDSNAPAFSTTALLSISTTKTAPTEDPRPTAAFSSTLTADQTLESTTINNMVSGSDLPPAIDSSAQHTSSSTNANEDMSDSAPPPGFTQPLPPTETTNSTQATCTPLTLIESQNAPYLGNFAQHPCQGEPRSFWRLPCRGQSGIGRIDPLMDPGGPGAHVHTISGGNGFGFNATFESLIHSTCTSCQVKQDKSAYWTPALMFMYDNGTTVMVEQPGGMLAYYKSFSETVAFPDGFSMVAGNPYVRNFTGPFPDVPQSDTTIWKDDPDEVGTPEQQFFLMQRAIGFNCLNYYGSLPPEASLYRHQLPAKEYMDYQCVDGLRLELAFPTCGNGSIDSADHKSHMKYPSLVQQGVCPTGYNVLFPLLFYETIYNTWAFAGVNGTFLLSYGDPIGTGYHGDFMMGWDSEATLLQAINECRNISGRVQDCSFLDLQSTSDQMACHFAVPDAVKEDNPLGPRNGLAVDVPVQYGPQQATTYPVAGVSGVPTRSFELSPPPKTVLGNLSIHPYGTLGNPTLMQAAGIGTGGLGTGALEFLTTAASTPVPAGMTPLSPLSYVSGVIAPQFSKYLTGPAPTSVVSNKERSSPASLVSSTRSDMASDAGCNGGAHRSPISIATSYETVHDKKIQIIIEDVELVITTRTKITITESTSTIDVGSNSEHGPSITAAPSEDSPPSSAPSGGSESSEYGSAVPSTTDSDGARPRFNTIMWVLGSKTYRTEPPGMETLSGIYNSQISQDGLHSDAVNSQSASISASETRTTTNFGLASSLTTDSASLLSGVPSHPSNSDADTTSIGMTIDTPDTTAIESVSSESTSI